MRIYPLSSLFGVVCIGLFLTACATIPSPPVTDPHISNADLTQASLAQADLTWQAYEAYSVKNQAIQKPFRITSSLRTRSENEDGPNSSLRATSLIWSNGKNNDPIRFDLTAGFGTVIARLLSAPNLFIAHVPRDKTALFYKGDEQPLLNLGTPLPMSLDKIVDIIQGHPYNVFGDRQKDMARPLDKQRVRFTLKEAILSGQDSTGSLDLNEQGLPVAWHENEDLAWQLDIIYNAAEPPLPKRLTFKHPSKGYEITLFIKKRAYPQKMFTQKQVELEIPEDTTWKEIKAYPKTP